MCVCVCVCVCEKERERERETRRYSCDTGHSQLATFEDLRPLILKAVVGNLVSNVLVETQQQVLEWPGLAVWALAWGGNAAHTMSGEPDPGWDGVLPIGKGQNGDKGRHPLETGALWPCGWRDSLNPLGPWSFRLCGDSLGHLLRLGESWRGGARPQQMPHHMEAVTYDSVTYDLYCLPWPLRSLRQKPSSSHFSLTCMLQLGGWKRRWGSCHLWRFSYFPHI